MRQFVEQMRKARGLSQGELAQRLGYKSATSVARILQDKANMDSVNRFCQLLKEHDGLALSDEEVSDLDRILEKKKFSSQEYAATEVLRELLHEDPPLTDPLLEDAVSGECKTLLETYTPIRNLRITILNCEMIPFFGAIARLVRENSAEVKHYLSSDQNLIRTVMTIRAVLPILYEERYNGYTSEYNRDDVPQLPRGISTTDVMLCEYEREDNPWHDLVIFQSVSKGLRFSFPGNGQVVYRMMSDVFRTASPIRNADIDRLRSDYLAYFRFCTDLEKDRSVYRIKPDFAVEQIPVEICRRALEESPAAHRLAGLGDVDALEAIFRERQNNAMSKRQAQHHVFKQKAVWKFVRTGRLSDHFWAFRPLTMDERLAVLQSLLEQYNTNPYFHLYFLKDEDAMRDEEIVCYDGVGLVIIKAGTDYDLSSNHSETMVEQKDFLRIYRNFFLHSVLTCNVHPEHKTRKTLMEMIQYCKDHLSE